MSQVTRVGGCNNEVAALLSDHYTEVLLYLIVIFLCLIAYASSPNFADIC